MKKTFTLDEANALIPTLTETLTRLQHRYAVLREKQQEFSALEQRIRLAGGMLRPPTLELRREIDNLVEQVKTDANAIDELGCELKDVAMGLVDFPSVRGDRLVYLCWKLGEPEIRYWHELSAGYAGRMPL